ncbi:hypothetical protein [Halalkalicoccus salilacus]|uniref:hypothetical protein n=1 Tax=Halalkalicoccus salilacus TaxID=3117459 RepID=UPI00300ECB51
MNAEYKLAPIKGLRSVVKPTFMLPAVGTAAGSLLAPTLDLSIGVMHALAVAAALYIAHLVDEYVDAHVRGEDVPLVSERAIEYAIAVATAVFLTLTARLWLMGGPHHRRRHGATVGTRRSPCISAQPSPSNRHC